MITAKGAGRTDVGRVRESNEDAFFVDDELGIYVVSDGMGGHAAGEQASRLAVEEAVGTLRAGASILGDVAAGTRPKSALTQLVADATLEACRRVHEEATSDRKLAGMGSTLTLLVVAGGTAAMAHVGDSRLYLVRGQEVSQLSADHTMAAELARAGAIGFDEVETHPYAHVLSRCIGTQVAVRVDTLLLELLPGDRLLLCSDGYSNYLGDPQPLAERFASGDLQQVTQRLVDEANEAGGKDNITVVAVACEAETEQPKRLARIEASYDALGSVFLFRDLDMSALSRVIAIARVEPHDAGAVVHRQGEVTSELFVAVSGRYVLRTEAQGDVETLEPGDHVGASTLFFPRAALASLVATEPARILRLRGEDVARLALARPWLGNQLMQRLARELSADVARAVTPSTAPHPEIERF